MQTDIESQTRLSTAWNLYRAIRMYPDPQDLMQRARDALEPDAMLHFIDGHARYIARWHNLDTPAMVASIGEEGVSLIAIAFAHEIRHGSPAETLTHVLGARLPDKLFMPIPRHGSQAETLTYMIGAGLPDERFIPISWSVEDDSGRLMPRITFNPLPFRDAKACAQYIGSQAAPLYNRVMHDMRVRGDELTQAEQGAQKEFLRTAKRVGARVEQIVRERGRQVLDSPGSWDDAIEYYRTHNKWPYNPEPGLTRPEFDFYWWNLTLDEEGHILYKHAHERRYAARQESITRHDTRMRAYPSIALHAAWWAANRVEGKSMRSLARQDGTQPSTVSRSLALLEARYVVSRGVAT
jgi:hypothetical protein